MNINPVIGVPPDRSCPGMEAGLSRSGKKSGRLAKIKRRIMHDTRRHHANDHKGRMA